jgi:mono/diheme cytochrome c family protein
MKRMIFLATCVGIALSISAMAQDELAFVPDSGREILFKVANKFPKSEGLTSLAAAGKKTPAEWKGYLAAKGVLAGLKEKQIEELVTYIAINSPFPKISGTAIKTADLPIGGKQIVLDKCQGCHSISIVVLSEKPEVAWFNVLVRTDHAQVTEELKEIEVNTLTAYLAINMPVPEKDVPEDMRVPSLGQ